MGRKKRKRDTKAAEIREAHAAGNAFDRMIESEQVQREKAAADAVRKRRRAERNRAKKQRQKLRRQGLLPPVRVPDYSAYLRSAHWKRKRQEALEYYGSKCRRCGSSSGLHVHHKNYARLNCEQMKDLEVLCGICHAAHHEADPKWLKRHGRVQGQHMIDVIAGLAVRQRK